MGSRTGGRDRRRGHGLATSVAAAGTAAATAAVGYRLADRSMTGSGRWWRTNFAGAPVSLLAGPASVLGAAVGALAAGRPVQALVVTGAGAIGLYDDLAGTDHYRGLRGHLAAVRAGTVTTGALKVAGLTGVAVVGALLQRRPRAGAGKPTSTSSRAVDVCVDAALIAGTANLVNLLDLRPGRAVKSVTVLGLPLAGAAGGAGAAVLGGLAGVVGPDLRGRSMLGDCGANAAGAGLAAAFTEVAPRPARLVALGFVSALTLASERVSFTTVIEGTRWLAAIDRLGRRDVPPAP